MAYGALEGRSILRYLTAPAREQLLARRNEVRQLLKGGSARLYNEDQKGGFRDERLCNRNIVEGPDFGGHDSGRVAYLPAWQRYSGRFFGSLLSRAPMFWKDLPRSVEVIFVSALYGLILWDEPIQEYDCHFADYIDHGERSVRDLWGDTLTTVLCGFLKLRSNPEQLARITILYDLLSESLYQGAFNWKEVKRSKIKVYHRIFRGISGPDILTALAMVAADNVSTFASRYREGWYPLGTDGDKSLEFGFEADIGEDVTATREGDLEKVEGLLSKEFSFLRDLPVDVRRALILAEVSRRKVAPLSAFDWGGIVVSFAKPVESFCKGILHLSSKETLGGVIGTVEHIKAWQPVYERLKALNQMFVRGKHLKPPHIQQNEVASARRLAFEIVERAEILRRSAIR